ncbi:MAG TPA: hypothetical protein VNF73_15650, partial [Candidatus Saccharimonadales bacterium]|nr:hypothetical protein [Candidatus Saccharimonadales bacterium]
ELASDGSTRPGWPVTIEGCVGVPTIGPDGTLYATAGCEAIVNGVSKPPVEPEQILALGPDGTERAGWPYTLPADLLAWPYAPVEGLPSRAYSPTAAPDGTIYLPIHPPGDYHRQGILAIASDGTARAGWPVWLPEGESLATPGSTGGGADLVPFAFGPDGGVYVSAESGPGEASILGLMPDGSPKPGWPFVAAGTDSQPIRIIDLTVLPDGSLLASGGSVVYLIPASGR